jgi:heat shock protein HslJ
MNKITRTMLILVSLGVVLSACAFGGASVDLKGTSWKLVSYGPVGNQVPAAAGITTRLDFGNDGTVSGNMGCNSFGGNFEVKNGNLVFNQMISTMMACLGPQMAQEDATLKVMNSTVRFQVDGSTLTIFDASGANVITLSK